MLDRALWISQSRETEWQCRHDGSACLRQSARKGKSDCPTICKNRPRVVQLAATLLLRLLWQVRERTGAMASIGCPQPARCCELAAAAAPVRCRLVLYQTVQPRSSRARYSGLRSSSSPSSSPPSTSNASPAMPAARRRLGWRPAALAHCYRERPGGIQLKYGRVLEYRSNLLQ